MKKIHAVTLKETEIVEDGQGGFKQITKGVKKIPCFITNYSLKMGKDLGLTEGSLIGDLLKLMPLAKLDKDDLNAMNSEDFDRVDEVEMMKLIYLGCIGADKNLEEDFDDFVSKYHGDFSETLILYVALLQDTIGNMNQKNKNKFAKGLQNSVSKTPDKNKKKLNHHR
ncbi:hypothetical protein [Niallia nealsonii]|uniref:Uncharacterized protein n=1 Tax=Niallia nealsonii TaxID=115979 RepID=A0A2N0Z364_9BACI|nr:hypothetical protein [Niallia nealsonii]PKG23947.1 hypothetical protein CWS01_09260 [Niallia nealsonii]